MEKSGRCFCIIIVALITIAAILSMIAVCNELREDSKSDSEIPSITINVDGKQDGFSQITINNVYVFKRGGKIPKDATNILVFGEDKIMAEDCKQFRGTKNFYFFDENVQSRFKAILESFENYQIRKAELRKSYLLVEVDFDSREK